MRAYGPLAGFYDGLTRDIPYGELAGFYERLLRKPGQEKNMTLLDLCCGTGTLCCLLAGRGHELIGVDASPDMLSVAQEKAYAGSYPIAPMFLCQAAEELDLYGTVEGAYCSLDGMNYLRPEALPELFRRLRLFIEPGGKFAFDLNTPERLRSLDGGVFVDEADGLLCLWRASFDREERALVYGMDIFTREKRLWRREQEEHVEYAHEPENLASLLSDAGFRNVEIITDGPLNGMGRIFIAAQN